MKMWRDSLETIVTLSLHDQLVAFLRAVRDTIGMWVGGEKPSQAEDPLTATHYH